MLLAIDTSTRYAGIALLDDEGQLDQLLQWRSQRNHTVEILPAIETLLQRGHTTVQDITGIAVAVGPGSFSALRIGLSIAKGLAWSGGLAVATVTTLEAEAFVHRLGGTPVCAALDAGREQLAWALFEERQGQLHQTGSERITGPANMLRSLPSPALICGEALERHGEALSETVPKGVRLALPYLPGQRLLAVAYLGTARIKAGLVQEPATIQPLYLRRPTITEPRRQSSAAAPDAGGTSLTGTVR